MQEEKLKVSQTGFVWMHMNDKLRPPCMNNKADNHLSQVGEYILEYAL